MSRNARAALGQDPVAIDWCGEVAAPPLLIEHLSKHHITVRVRGSARTSSPSRVSAVSLSGRRVAGKRARALRGRRVAILHPDASSADTIAQALRARGAAVALMSLDPAALLRVESLDPEVIVVEPEHAVGECWSTIEALLRHPLLRWSCLLLSPSGPLSAEGGEMQDIPALCADIQLLCADYDAAVACTQGPTDFSLSLESVGPGRVLRLLVDSGKSFRAVFSTASATVEVDVAEGLVVGARSGSGSADEQPLLGLSCISALLNESTGVVQVRPVVRPAVTNIMAPLDAVISSALRACVSAPALAAVENPAAHSAVTASVPPVQTRTLIGLFAPKPSVSPPAGLPPVRREPSMRPRSMRPVAPEDGTPSLRALPVPHVSMDEPIPVSLANTGPLERVSQRSRVVLRQPSAKLVGGGIIAALVASTLLAIDAPPASRTSSAWEAQANAAPLTQTASVSFGRMVGAAVFPAAGAGFRGAPDAVLTSASDLPSGVSLPTTELGAPDAARPRPSPAQIRRANALAKQGANLLRRKRTALAKRRFEAALEVQWNSPRALAGLISVAREQHDPTSALLYAQMLVKEHRFWPNSHLLLGDARELAGDRAAAKIAWRAAARLGSRPARARLRSFR